MEIYVIYRCKYASIRCKYKALDFQSLRRLLTGYTDYSDKNYEKEFKNMNSLYPVRIYLFKANNRKTRAICKICSKLTIEKLE